MNLRENLLRGIYGYGFEKPSAIQQRAIIPCIRGESTIFTLFHRYLKRNQRHDTDLKKSHDSIINASSGRIYPSMTVVLSQNRRTYFVLSLIRQLFENILICRRDVLKNSAYISPLNVVLTYFI